MQFTLIDRITDLQPGISITAVKTLHPSEEYLRDHFPKFPVMPGVMMLETLYQVGAWLVRKSEDFLHGVVLLQEARHVKFADFVQPGETLVVTCHVVKQDARHTTLKAQGVVGGVVAVSGTLVLERFNVADVYPTRGAWNTYARRKAREQFALLYRPGDSTPDQQSNQVA
jgi:3-hydroxyacyl-[acyl-carrier-protein] dehydratase